MVQQKQGYSEELTAEIVQEYTLNPSRDTVDAIALRINKTARSVIAKLASAGVYQTPVRTTKTGDAIVKKEELAADIGRWIEQDVSTLVKSGKQDLLKLHKALKEIFENVDS